VAGKVKVKGLARLNARLKRALSTKNKPLLDEIGVFTLNRIQTFTRAGKSIAGRKPKGFKGLSSSYKAFRKGLVFFFMDDQGQLRKVPKRSKALANVDKTYFKPTKSNLTFTGQMIKSLTFKTTVTKSSVAVFPKGRRKGSKLSNKKVAEFVSANGRPFIGIDTEGIKVTVNMIKRFYRRQLKREGLR